MFDVVILAGTTKQSELTTSEQVENKAFVQIHGRPMLDYVISALRSVSSIDRIMVVGPTALKQIVEPFGVTVVAQGSSIVENVQRGFEALAPRAHFLVATSDIPFLTPAAVEDFISKCHPYDYDLYYPIVSRDVNDRRFPGVKRTYVKLKDGEYTGGNLFFVNPECLGEALPRLNKIFALRKSPVRLAATLGFGFVIKLLAKKLTIRELEARFSALFAVRSLAIITDFAEIGTDVDKPDDLALARKDLKV